MNASQLNLKPQGYLFSTSTFGGHYKLLMSLGRCLPKTKAQAKYFMSNVNQLDVLNYDDVANIEALLSKHNLKGDYKPTKSGTWVRLTNINVLKEAIKKEFFND